jgi:hypothetical protein
MKWPASAASENLLGRVHFQVGLDRLLKKWRPCLASSSSDDLRTRVRRFPECLGMIQCAINSFRNGRQKTKQSERPQIGEKLAATLRDFRSPKNSKPHITQLRRSTRSSTQVHKFRYTFSPICLSESFTSYLWIHRRLSYFHHKLSHYMSYIVVCHHANSRKWSS